MTREILFRAKRLDNGEWVEGCLVKYAYNSTPYIGYLDAWGDGVYEVDPTTVGQYTGLTANGKKIFEGDIVNFTRINALGYTTRRTGVVRYYDKLPVFYIKATTGDAWDWCVCEDIEVIGNVVDNAELLEE